MTDPRYIWDHEKKQAAEIAARLLAKASSQEGIGYFQKRRRQKTTRQNLLFTKRLAFEAAKRICKGEDREAVFASLNHRTEEILAQDKKGLYTEKIRHKQLFEIRFLVDHYILLIKEKEAGYEAKIRQVYPTREDYEAFVDKLRGLEREVVQATLSSLRKGTRKERQVWFFTLNQVVEDVTLEELERLYPL